MLSRLRHIADSRERNRLHIKQLECLLRQPDQAPDLIFVERRKQLAGTLATDWRIAVMRQLLKDRIELKGVQRVHLA